MTPRSEIRRARAAAAARALSGRLSRAALAALLTTLALASPALAGPPVHASLPGEDVAGLNKACGAAVDSEGDLYAASAAGSKIEVFAPEDHATPIAEITNANQPCSLAVDTKGRLYVSEKATGNVVRYLPNAYPLGPSPSFSGPQAFDPSGAAKGIAVDPVDDRLYVAEGTRVSVFQADGTTGQDAARQLVVRPSVTAGSFKLCYDPDNGGPEPAQCSASISYDATAAQVQSALGALPAIGSGNVEVEEGFYGNRSYTMTFTHALGSQAGGALSTDSSGLTGGEASLVSPSTSGFAFSGHIGEGELTDATAVAVFSYTNTGERRQRRLFVADSASDEVVVFSTPPLKLEPTIEDLPRTGSIDGAEVPDSPACPNCSEGFGFGSEGAAIATNWADGHLFVYDPAHEVVDELEANGRYLDQVAVPGVEDAAPSGLAALPERSAMQEVTIKTQVTGSFKLAYEGAETASISVGASAATVQAALEALPGIGAGNVSVRRSVKGTQPYQVRFGGALAFRRVADLAIDVAGLSTSEPEAAKTERLPGGGPGRLYLGSGAGAGAGVLAFSALAPPSRAPIPALTRELQHAAAIETDFQGDVYVAAEAQVHVFNPAGEEMASFEDTHLPLRNLAVDSTGKVYVVEDDPEPGDNKRLVYYTPSAFPPVSGTTYARHEPSLADHTTYNMNPDGPKTIAVNPSDDHLLVFGAHSLPGFSHSVIVELDSAAHGSTFIREFAPTIDFGANPQSIDVYGRNGDVYVSEDGIGSGVIDVVNAAGTEVLARITGAGSPNGRLAFSEAMAVDQSDGHVLAFRNQDGAAQEFDAAGGFVAEFGAFNTAASPIEWGIAIDNSGGPNDGNVYVGFDDPTPGTPDLWAFGPLSYGEAPLASVATASEIGEGKATLNGTVNPDGFAVSECRFEYLTEAEYEAHGDTFSGAQAVACEPQAAALGAGSNPVAVKAGLEGLDPEGRYRFRLVAENKFGQSEDAGLFGPPLIVPQSANPISYREASLHAEVDPSGLDTTYRFQYGTSAAYDQSTPTEAIPAGDGAAPIEATLGELQEGTTYHYRLIAENEAGAGASEDATFTTQARRGSESCANAEYRTGFSASLPDCRAFELTTPAETRGASLLSPQPIGTPSAGFNRWLSAPRGALAGEALSFATGATLPGFEGSGDGDAYLSRRAQGEGPHPAAGWSSEVQSPSYTQQGGSRNSARSYFNSADQLFSFFGPYEEAFAEGALAEGIWLRTPAGFEIAARGSLGADLGAANSTGAGKFIGEGGSHVIFASREHLEPEAPPAGNEALYDRAAGATSAQVLTLPPGGASEEERDEFEAALRSKEQAAFLGASEDGATVAFKAGAGLYARQDDLRTAALSPRTATVGDPLSCAEGPLQGVALANLHFQWLRNGAPIAGASGSGSTQPDYTTAAADAGTALQCLVFVLEGGTGSVAVSSPVEIAPLQAGQPPQPPAVIAAPNPAKPHAGTIETCSPGIWEGATALAYQWYVDGEAIAAATAQTYEVQAADVPGTIQCEVSGSNAAATVSRASALRSTNPAPASPAPIATAQALARATYAGISQDGRYLFFALGAGNSSARIFRFDMSSEEATEIAPDSIFAGLSGDGTHVLFSSKDALTGAEENESGEEAVSGQRNLYLWDGATSRFIAVVDPRDFTQGFGSKADENLAAWAGANVAGVNAGRLNAPTRSTPTGDAGLFQSHARLTAYDNEGVGEIYRYAPAAPEGQRLLCVSCDPSGAPPSADALLVYFGSGPPLGAKNIVPNISADGSKVFLQSEDRLLPEDANSAADVYEWQAQGSGGCTQARGCLALISSGQGEKPSYLYSMSEDGRDVFFETLDRLVGADVPGSFSIYDARVGGGIPEAGAQAPCQGDSCQGQGSAPPVLAAPESGGAGGGNLPPAGAKPRCPKGKHLVGRKGKAHCLARHAHRRHHRAKRANRNRGGSR